MQTAKANLPEEHIEKFSLEWLLSPQVAKDYGSAANVGFPPMLLLAPIAANQKLTLE
jgi:hypothetical protein